MLRDITESYWDEDVSYQLCFTDDDGNGFSFNCDKEGNLLLDTLAPEAIANYRYCCDHKEKFAVFNKVVKYKTRYKVPAQGVCDCGEVVILEDEYMGACQCENCGKWYSLSGQELLPPDEWGWDGTPMDDY